MLKNHAHPFPKLVDIRLRIRDILSVYDNPAFSNFLKLVQAAKEGGFPTAGRADNDNNFTLVDFCGNALKYNVSGGKQTSYIDPLDPDEIEISGQSSTLSGDRGA